MHFFLHLFFSGCLLLFGFYAKTTWNLQRVKAKVGFEMGCEKGA